MDSNILLLTEPQASVPWLSLIVLLPAAGALLMPFLPGEEKKGSNYPRNFALTFLLIDFLLIIGVINNLFYNHLTGIQLAERINWIPLIGLEWSLGIDGISAPLVVLSGLITLLSAAASWKLNRKTKLYFALLLVQASAQSLVFLSQDFLLFFLAWELELVPV